MNLTIEYYLFGTNFRSEMYRRQSLPDPVLSFTTEFCFIKVRQTMLPDTAPVLIELSGKKKPDSLDVEILLRDRQALEGIVKAILTDRRLAEAITSAYLRMTNYVRISRPDYDQYIHLMKVATEALAEKTEKNMAKKN